MIVMLDTSSPLEKAAEELGGVRVEQLLTPLTRRKPQYPEHRFAIDNGAFAQFECENFLSLLERERPRRDLCRFVAVPDVVGSARRTLECFEAWRDRLAGWPLALVVQDGQENLAIPWESIAAVFIGGTTGWKLSDHAEAIVRASKIMGKWSHVGRVNTPGRYEKFKTMGADSIDGTGMSRYTHMREKIHQNETEPRLI